MFKVDKIGKEEAGRAVLGLDDPDEISLLLKQSESMIAHDKTLGEWIIMQMELAER